MSCSWISLKACNSGMVPHMNFSMWKVASFLTWPQQHGWWERGRHKVMLCVDTFFNVAVKLLSTWFYHAKEAKQIHLLLLLPAEVMGWNSFQHNVPNVQQYPRACPASSVLVGAYMSLQKYACIKRSNFSESAMPFLSSSMDCGWIRHFAWEEAFLRPQLLHVRC